MNADEAEPWSRRRNTAPLALEAARQAIVLLQTRDNALPFDRTKLKTLAVIGPERQGRARRGYSSIKPPASGTSSTASPQGRAGVQVGLREGLQDHRERDQLVNDKVVWAIR